MSVSGGYSMLIFKSFALHSFSNEPKLRMWALSMYPLSFSVICLGNSAFLTTWPKVAPVVNLKLAFTGWFFYNLIIVIKLCKIRYLN